MVFTKRAYDISRKKVFFCNTTDSLNSVADKMHMNNIGSILVKKGGSIKGIITVNDMMRTMSKNKEPKTTLAEDIMSYPVVTISKDTEVDELAEKFTKEKVSRMVLVDSRDNVVGIVRDIAVYKCISLNKYNIEAKKRFGEDYSRPLY